MHCGSEPEWISAWEIDYNRVDVSKTEANWTEDAQEGKGNVEKIICYCCDCSILFSFVMIYGDISKNMLLMFEEHD
jgi:hypothetical protein